MNTLVDRGEKATSPDTLASIRGFSATGENHEPGQVFVFGAESIGGPRTERCSAEQIGSGMQEKLCRGVIKLFRLHRLHDGDVVDDFRQKLPDFAQLCTRFAVFRKIEGSPQHVGNPLDEGESLSFEVFFRAGLAVVLLQSRLVVEEIELRGTAGHVQINNVLGFCGERRFPGCQRICRTIRISGHTIALQQGRQSDRSQSNPGLPEEMAARNGLQVFLV